TSLADSFAITGSFWTQNELYNDALMTASVSGGPFGMGFSDGAGGGDLPGPGWSGPWTGSEDWNGGNDFGFFMGPDGSLDGVSGLVTGEITVQTASFSEPTPGSATYYSISVPATFSGTLSALESFGVNPPGPELWSVSFTGTGDITMDGDAHADYGIDDGSASFSGTATTDPIGEPSALTLLFLVLIAAGACLLLGRRFTTVH
ncbi:MAG: hypothetical protein ACRD19_16685, partial [Terriglobia bacterium]